MPTPAALERLTAAKSRFDTPLTGKEDLLRLLDESEIPYLRTLPAKRRLREILAEMRGTTPDPGVALDDRRSEMRDELDAVRWSDPRSGCLSVLR